ncbi:MAG: type II toxin-antitoxin system VapC family toxin [Hyphomicrobiales bacterium]|nr:type II toxin-antitoxin system VapC family toxin [Hyphomicrobiales bacterium]
MALVVDASIAVGWIARTQATRLTDAALSAVASDFARVPSYFGIEVARALRTQERRDLLTAELVDAALVQLRALPLREDNSRTLDTAPALVALARREGLRIADAAYLELALRAGLPLATRDVALARAAVAVGATLFET